MTREKSKTMQQFLRKGLDELIYGPVEKPPDMTMEAQSVAAEDVVRMHLNESAFGCSPRVIQALGEYQNFNRYPDAGQKEVRQLLADYVGTSPDHIVGTGGADQLLDLIVRLFIDPGDEVIAIIPTFARCSFSAKLCGGIVKDVLRNDSFAIDVPAVKAAVNERTKLIFLANPNNPTGNITPEADILELVQTGIPIIIDEAYYEFSEETVVPFIDRFPNLMVVRTLSKWAGLAGFRFGYGIMNPEIAECIMNIRPPYLPAVPSVIALRESLKDMGYLRKNIDTIINERKRLFKAFKILDYLSPHPSSANFIYCSVVKGSAKTIADELAKVGLLIRHYDTPLLKNGLRITIGKPEENTRLISVLGEIGKSL